MSSEGFTPELFPSIAQNFSQFPGDGLLEAANLDPLRMKPDRGMGGAGAGAIAFIDPTVADYQTLINGIKPDTEIVVLDPNSDGVQQITDALTGEIYSAVHIISHGSPGSIQIGSSHLGYDNIINYAGALQQWQKSLTPDADILLYGCDVAADELSVGGDTRQGINSQAHSVSRLKPTGNAIAAHQSYQPQGLSPGSSFVQQLAQLTGADIAASDNLTGSAALGGDWQLEAKTGNIEASITFVAGSTDAYNDVLNGDLIWAKQLGGTSHDEGTSIATDSAGNVYTTGYFYGTADFDPSSGTFNLTSQGFADIFVSKLNSDGSFAWAKQLGGTVYEIGNSIAIDSAGNVYTTGRFSGIADFDPSSGTFNLTCFGSADIFVTKLNSDGNLVWAKQLGGADYEIGNSIATDSAGNVYTTGRFPGIADFDGGSDTFNLTSKGLDDIFVSKLNSDGRFAWAKQLGGKSTSVAEGNSIATDSAGNVYTTGRFSGTADFDGGSSTFNLTSKGSNDIFVTKLNSDGSFAWAKQLGGTDYDSGNSIATDSAGNVYTTGRFSGTADFDPSSGTFNLISKGSDDIFVSKLNSDGSFAWAKQLGGTGFDVGTSIVTDSAGNVYTTGYFQGTADFDPSSGTFNLTSKGSNDIFVTKLNSDGSFAWAKQLGGTSFDVGTSIATDSAGNVYTTGWFEGTADFDGGSGTFNLTSKGSEDIFVAKLGTLANTAPILDLNGAASGINYSNTFTRRGGAVAVVDSSNLSLTDDGNSISSATVTITNPLNGASEILSAVTTGTNIAASYNNGILTLTGSDTVANYQTVLRSIAYNNTAVIPNTTSRNIEFVVNDGSLDSAFATTTLAIYVPTINLGNNITTATRSRPRVASLNNNNSEALYSFTLNGATRVVANLMMNGGNADLALLDSSGTILASSIRGGTLAENFDIAGLSAGQYFIRVYRVDPGATVNYQLSVNFA